MIGSKTINIVVGYHGPIIENNKMKVNIRDTDILLCTYDRQWSALLWGDADGS